MKRGGDGVGTVKDEDGEGETERGGNGWRGDGERVRQRVGEVKRKASISERETRRAGTRRAVETEGRETERGRRGGYGEKGDGESERQIKGRRIEEMRREGRCRERGDEDRGDSGWGDWKANVRCRIYQDQ